MKILSAICVLCICVFIACDDAQNPITDSERNVSVLEDPQSKELNPEDWLIPKNQVVDGGAGRDGIIALDNPLFISANEVNYLEETDRVVGIRIGNDIRAYPHKILDRHEIINDLVNDIPISVTFCYLTGTAIGYHRQMGDTLLQFGVSGLLYNSNLIAFDRNTESYWPQIEGKSVHGPLIGSQLSTFPVVETSWQTWKHIFPDTKVLSPRTGYGYDYSRPAFSNIVQEHNELSFPVRPIDNRLPLHARVLGIIGKRGRVEIYPISIFDDETRLIQFTMPTGEQVVVIGNQDSQVLVAYARKLSDGKVLTFEKSESLSSGIMRDQEGTVWDITGTALNGRRTGQQLTGIHAFTGYWFAFAAFFPHVVIREQQNTRE